MSELARAFQELRCRSGAGGAVATGSSSGGGHAHAGALGGTFSGTAAAAAHGGTSAAHAANAAQAVFVSVDPSLQAEELRRKLEDAQGFHFRGDAARLLESTLPLAPPKDEPLLDDLPQRPADLAW